MEPFRGRWFSRVRHDIGASRSRLSARPGEHHETVLLLGPTAFISPRHGHETADRANFERNASTGDDLVLKRAPETTETERETPCLRRAWANGELVDLSFPGREHVAS